MKFKTYSVAIVFTAIIIAGGFMISCQPDYASHAPSYPGYLFLQSKGPIREYEVLSNHLRVILTKDHSMPLVTLVMVYHAGSRNELREPRGAAHFLEHMMFKGSRNYDKPSTIARIVKKAGGQINAATLMDGTYYYATLPSNKLELAIAAESDRMRNALLDKTEFESERTVIQNELRRLEDSPLHKLEDTVWDTAYEVHPYKYPVIGTEDDLEKIKIEDIRQFYNTYYWPNNATIVVTGDFDEKDTLSLIQNYFGQIRPSPNKIQELALQEPLQNQGKSVFLETREKLRVILIAHKVPRTLSEDGTALEVLAQILGQGKTSRLHRRLVDQGLATEVHCSNSKTYDEGLLTTKVVLTPDANSAEVKEIVLNAYEEILRRGVTNDEVNRAKYQLLAQSAYAKDGTYAIAMGLSEGVMLGDWTYFVTHDEFIQNVTATDIKRPANRYLSRGKMTIGYLNAKPGQLPVKLSHTVPRQKNGHTAYRFPEKQKSSMTLSSGGLPSIISKSFNRKLSKRSAEQFIGGIKLITVPTAIRDVVTIAGSFEGAGSAYSKNRMLPRLVTEMLDQGTRYHDRFRTAEILEELGAEISFDLNQRRVGFSARCLKKDFPRVMLMTAEQLRFPSFDPQEFERQKQRLRAEIYKAMSSPLNQARAALTREIYSPHHPNYEIPFEKQLQELDRITLESVKIFHKTHYGPQNMTVIVTGDVQGIPIEEVTRRAFRGWTQKSLIEIDNKLASLSPRPPIKKFVRLENKKQLGIAMGHALPLHRLSSEFLPVYLANEILGGEITDRLGLKIRDEQGLTYGIRSQVTGLDEKTQGHWQIQLSLDPDVLGRGMDAVFKEIQSFLKEGVTSEELEDKKNTLIGHFEISLSTSRGLANEILYAEELGFGINYLDQYVDLLKKVSLESTNRAARRFFHPEELNTVISGSVEETISSTPSKTIYRKNQTQKK